jgi:hypothetical protein
MYTTYRGWGNSGISYEFIAICNIGACNFEQQEQQRHHAAVNALEFFVSKYSPATINDADTFYTTAK